MKTINPRYQQEPFKNRKKQSEIKMNDMLTSFLTLHLLQQLDPDSAQRKSLTDIRIKIQDGVETTNNTK